jgi:S1-C subfamily serine protease
MAALVAAVLSSTTQPAMAESFFPWSNGTQSSATATATPATLEMKAPDTSTSDLAPEEVATVNLFKDNTPSVVNIANIGRRQDRWTMDVQNVPQGLGSGFIWDQQGHIVTNFHVIRNAAEVQVALIDQSVHRATLVGGDPDKDIAVLKLQCDAAKLKELKPVILGNSSNLLVGQKVYAIGNPFGLDHTLTQGIISGLGRELATPGPRGVPIRNAIQTDAAINPGNSGGVLLDSKGRLIGINTAIADPTGRGASSGVGFAIPVDSARGLVEQILKFGRVVRPVLGITIAPPQAVRQLGVDGVLVLEVPSGSPAAKAGIKGTYRDASGRLVLGDVITGINGKPVKLQKDLFGILDDLNPNDRIQVEVLRDGQPRQLTVTLGERSDDNATRGGYIQADYISPVYHRQCSFNIQIKYSSYDNCCCYQL